MQIEKGKRESCRGSGERRGERSGGDGQMMGRGLVGMVHGEKGERGNKRTGGCTERSGAEVRRKKVPVCFAEREALMYE